MVENDTDAKSCDPQLFMDGEPDSKWGLDDLGGYAQSQHRAIADGEQTLAPCYWRLGLALNLARRQLSRRQWGRFLQERNIDKTRASKARAIHRTFPTENVVEGLSVQEAYRRRERKVKRQNSGESTVEESVTEAPCDDLLSFLQKVRARADFFMDDAGFTEPGDTDMLLAALSDAVVGLEKLRDLVERQVSSG